jgi:hypothetical protein
VNPNSRSQLFRQLAQQLRDGCQRRGLTLPDGAAENILAGHITAVAKQLRVTDRHAMQTYFTDEAVDHLVEKCLQAPGRTRPRGRPRLAPAAAPPARRPHHRRPRHGITAATTSADHSTATTAIREAADTLTNIALALSRAGDTGHALIAPATAVAARAELTRFADHLADGTWTIPHDDAADEPNDPDRTAERRQRLRDAVLHDISYLQ